MVYLYDETGSPIGLKYRTSTYGEVSGFDSFFFEKNLQGDIIAIYNASGTKIGSYTYDAWGNHTYSTASGTTGLERKIVSTYNPFRYRGYFYDVETQWYYLQSRYYNPTWARFVNHDSVSVLSESAMMLTDKNLYAYCDNNPIARTDNSGDFWETLFDIASVVVSVVDVVNNPSDPWAWGGLIADTVDLIPFVTGVGEATRAVNTSRKVLDKIDDVHDVVKTVDNVADAADSMGDAGKAAKKIHGNSLQCPKKNYGYALIDNDSNIVKFGESINPQRRYTKKYLRENEYRMIILEEGSKAEIHEWQHNLNVYYKTKYGKYPSGNARGW